MWLIVNLSEMLPDLSDVPESLMDESIFDSFLSWTRERGISLYPAQEEAALGILAGDNVILATPTGSGKSMVLSPPTLLPWPEASAVFTPPPSRRW